MTVLLQARPLLSHSSLAPRLTSAEVPKRFFIHQDNLPRLPVPPLQQTLDKFISSSTPLFDEEELKRAKELVEEFGRPGGDGENLQNLLLEKAKGTVNWVSLASC